MLFETLSQPHIFLWLFVGGFVCGFLFDLKSLLVKKFKKNRFFEQILMFFASIFTFLNILFYLEIILFVFFVLNLKLNYGQFRAFCIFSFFLSFCFERTLSKNFLAKPLTKCYNKIKGKRNEKKKV